MKLLKPLPQTGYYTILHKIRFTAESIFYMKNSCKENIKEWKIYEKNEQAQPFYYQFINCNMSMIFATILFSWNPGMLFEIIRL